MKTANLAIVFTDIKGFTERTSRQTLGENERLLDVHSKLLTPLFQAFGGRIVKSIGDAFMATFESPTQAVLCGVAIQDRLWLHNRTAPESQELHVRIAINVGEVRIENKDVFGEPVNIAARVEGITEAGEVYFTEAVYLSMNKAEVPSQLVGEFELKGIPGKIKVFGVPKAPYRVEAPAAAIEAAQAMGELPPYGNLGLSRVKERDESVLDRVARSPELKVATDKMGAAVNTIASKARSVAKDRPAWVIRRAIPVAVVCIVVLLALVVAATSKNDVEKAIDAVRTADEQTRFDEVRKAEALIDKVKDPEERYWYAGQLDEAQDDFSGAVSNYKLAVKKGGSRAEKRILKLLDDPSCQARTAAARAAGDLKLKKAKGTLQDLAEEGGPGEGSGGILGLGSCDSKRAAREALRQLE